LKTRPKYVSGSLPFLLTSKRFVGDSATDDGLPLTDDSLEFSSTTTRAICSTPELFATPRLLAVSDGKTAESLLPFV
jgi:hypothetical protein